MFGWKTVLQIGIFCTIYSTTIQTETFADKIFEYLASEKTYIIEDIDLDKIEDEKGLTYRYKFAIIAFWGAMNAELLRLTSSDSKYKKYLSQVPISNSLIYFVAQDWQKFSLEDYNKIIKFANEAVTKFSKTFNDQPNNGVHFEYPSAGHYYRLLLWLKYNMRYLELRSTSLEGAINEIPRHSNEIYKAKMILEFIFPESKIQSECSSIKTFQDLKTIGNKEDEMFNFCFEIAHTDGRPDLVQKFVESLNEPVEVYENFLEHAMKTPTTFYAMSLKYAEEVQMYIYEAQNMKLGINYTPINPENIILDISRQGNLYQYFRDLVVLFCKISDQKLSLESFHNIDHLKQDVLLLEHLNVNETSLTTTKVKTLGWWARNLIIDGYDQMIVDLETFKRWDHASKLCYYDLVKWLVTHFLYINAEQLGDSYKETLTKTTTILIKSRASGNPNSTEVNFSEEESKVYLQMNTWVLLHTICDKFRGVIVRVPE